MGTGKGSAIQLQSMFCPLQKLLASVSDQPGAFCRYSDSTSSEGDLPIVEETVLGPQFWMPPIESSEVSGVAALRHVRAETIAAGKAKYEESGKQEHCRHLTNAPFAPPP